MTALKVLTVVGTRPEIIRLSRVLASLEKSCNHVLVHTGQNYDYELNQIFFEEMGIKKPNYFLKTADNSSSSANTIGNIINEVDQVLAKEKPDAMLVLGDTNSCLSVIPAKRRKIPIFHMEAGNRCFDQRVPEETNRRIIDHTADVNLTYSAIARDYLFREGLPSDLVIKTGSPMFEVLSYYRQSIDESLILRKLNLKKNQYFLVSAHREENIESPRAFTKLVQTLNSVAKKYGIPVIVSTHPRTQKKIDTMGSSFDPLVTLLKPMGFFDYNHLQTSACAVLSDSGTISEESSILGFPALNLRESHERPEGMEEAVVMMVGLEPKTVLQGLAVLAGGETMRPVEDYLVPNVAAKVVRIIHSYTDYVNRVVWRKY